MTETQITKLVQSVFKDNKRQLQITLATIIHEIATPGDEPPELTSAEKQRAKKMLKEGGNEPSLINDPDFIADFEGLFSTMPPLGEAMKAAKDQAQKYLGSVVDRLCRILISSVRRIQLEDIQAKPKFKEERRSERAARKARRSLVQKVNSLSESCDSP